jgi:phage/plasmid-associated DNA primase
MDKDLRELLHSVATQPDDIKKYTHMTHYGQETKWYVSNQNMSNFWNKYCTLLCNTDLKKNGLCLSELPGNEIPLIQDFIFKFQDEDNVDDWEPYDEYFICWICYLYQQVIQSLYNMIDDNQLVVVVLESTDHWFEDDKQGRYLLIKLRLQFPNTKISTYDQDTIIRNEVITLLRKYNILSKMQRTPVGDWDSIMTKNIKNTPITMYGSSYNKNVPILKMIHLWPKIYDEIINNFYEPDELDINDVFSVNNHALVNNGIINKQIFNNNIEDEYYLLPLYLSINYCTNIMLLKNSINKKNSKYDIEQPRIFGEKKSKYENKSEEGIDLADKLLCMVKSTRFLQESFWLDIGRALYNTDIDNGLISWTRCTINSAKHLTVLPEFLIKNSGNINNTFENIISEACRNVYNTFGLTHITLKTIAFYVREDDPDGYNAWHKSWCLDAMEKALSCSDTELCEALYRFHWLDFVYDNANKKWFYFGQHGWIENSEGFYLRKEISNTFMKKFEAVRISLAQQASDSDDDRFKSESDITLKKINYVITQLKKVPCKNRIMIEAKECFGFDKFSSFLDKNKDLTGVKNGVLEIIGKDIIYRKTKPEDYMSMCMGVPFHDYFTWKHPLVEECMTWLGQTYAKDLLHHVLKFGSSGFIARNADKIFTILSGSGDNSKSMIIKLFEFTFGVYAVKIPVSILTEKNANSGNATPQLAQTKNCRWAFLDEADNEVSMKKAAIKRYTGGDSFFGRMLNENGGSIELTVKIVMIVNDIPPITEADEPTKKRVKIIPHLNKWVDHPENYQNDEKSGVRYFKKDINFEKRIPVLAAPFLWILTQYFPLYATEGLNDPQSVIDHTTEYWDNTDVYGIFINEKIEEVYTDDTKTERDLTKSITMNELYGEFKVFFKNSYPTDNVPNRDIVRAQFVKRWGKYGKKGWCGLNIINTDIDIIGAFIPK